MTKILIAQIYYGRGMNSATGDESKASFTMEQVDAALAIATKVAGEEVTLDNAEDEDFDNILEKIFMPNFEEGFGAALKKVLAGEQMFVEEEETLHGMALDLNDAARTALMTELRKRWNVAEENDEDGWDD